MPDPVVPKRPRGRPRKDGLPAGSVLPNSPSNPPASLLVVLRYNPKKKCLCKKSVQLAPYFCPRHGLYDNKSKGPTHQEVPQEEVPHKEAAYTQLSKKRKRDEDEDEDEQCDMFPETLTTSQSQQPQRGNRISPTLLATKRYKLPLCVRRNKVRNLAIEYTPDRHQDALPQPERDPLTEIDFLDAPLEARKLIYRYLLVPSTKMIVFRTQWTPETFGYLNPELQTDILLTNSQIYKECVPILYGENTFVARDTSDFFFPTGIQGLRRTTAQRIKHISIFRKGGAKDCDITSQALAASLHGMALQSPALLNLQTLTIRFEVSRPVDVKMWELQTYVQGHGVDANTIRALYKKYPIVMDAAARVAYKALRKRSPFQGLRINEESEHTASEGGKDCRINVNEVRLYRGKEQPVDDQEKMDLQQAIANMLIDEKENEVQGAEARWTWFKKHYLS